MERVPRVGTRVVFKPSKAARLLYTKSNDPSPGEMGTVSTVSLGCARRHFMPGPRGAELRRSGRSSSQAFAIAARTQREHCKCRTRRGPRGGRQLHCKRR